MKQGKKFLDFYVNKIDGRYPNIQKEFPKTTHIGFNRRFEGGLPVVQNFASQLPEVTRRKYPPKVRIFEI